MAITVSDGTNVPLMITVNQIFVCELNLKVDLTVLPQHFFVFKLFPFRIPAERTTRRLAVQSRVYDQTCKSHHSAVRSRLIQSEHLKSICGADSIYFDMFLFAGMLGTPTVVLVQHMPTSRLIPLLRKPFTFHLHFLCKKMLCNYLCLILTFSPQSEQMFV